MGQSQTHPGQNSTERFATGDEHWGHLIEEAGCGGTGVDICTISGSGGNGISPENSRSTAVSTSQFELLKTHYISRKYDK